MINHRIASSLVFLGQMLIILGVVSSAWHLGGVTSSSQQLLSIASLAVLIIAALVMLLRDRPSPVSFALPAIACLFCVYAVVQGLVFQSPIDPGNQANQIGAASVNAINQAITQLATPTTTVYWSVDSALLSHRTQKALVPLASGIAFLIGASILFRTRQSRIIFAIAVLANSAALVCWGFIQRSGNNEFILPGMLHELDTVPFASFIYKNAGAAALIPAIAISVVALLKGRLFQWSSVDNASSQKRSAYGSNSKFFELSNLVLISVVLFLAAGLVISLCRGAWLAVVVAVAIALVFDRRLKMTKANLSAIAIGGMVVLTLLFILGGNSIAKERAGDMTLDRLSSDQRWAHWPDGWDTAIAHFPIGSGLGTYRYATLPHQRIVHKSWFKNAHNQYLEIFTESGVIGLALLLLAIAWMARHCVGLIRDGADSSSRRWGMIGLIVLVSGCIQSTIDFVLIIPANLYMYAAVFGIAVSCVRRTVEPATASSPWWGWNPGWKLPAATVLASSVFLLASINFCSNQRYAERVLSQTLANKLREQPTDQTAKTALDQLDDAIERLPNSPELRSRRATWEIVRMRSAIIRLANQSGEKITWKATEPKRLFAALLSAPEMDRLALVEEFRSAAELRQHLVAALSDLKRAACLEPCIPQNHINAAFLAPLAGMPIENFIPTIAKLSNNSHHLLYHCGLIAFLSGDSDTAVESWNRCLEIRLDHIEPIYKASSQTFSPALVVSRIIPSRRMDLAVRLISNVSNQSVQHRTDIASEIVTAIEDRDDMRITERWSWIAKVHESVQQHEQAAVAWQNAVATGGRNLDHRYSFALSLSRIGQTEKAIDQALLGSAIASDDERFERLIKHCRRQLTQKSKHNRPVSRSAVRPVNGNSIDTKVSL